MADSKNTPSSSLKQEKDVPFSRPATPALRQAQTAVVGLGEMGRRIATNLARAMQEQGRPPLLVWNRSSDKYSEFESYAKEKGVDPSAYNICTKLEDLVKRSNLILTSLSGEAAAKEVYEKMYRIQADHLPERQSRSDPSLRGTIFAETSTIYPTAAGSLERECAQGALRSYIACPIFGVPRQAAKADITLAMAGDYYAKKIVAHILCPAVCKKVMDLGSNPERAMSFKLTGNALELGFIELLSECFTLADQTGVGSSNLLELVKSQHNSPALVRYSERIMQNKFDATGGFTVDGGLADSQNIRHLADTNNVPMPVVDVAHGHLITARAQGSGQMDWTALVGGQRIAAGLQPFAGKTHLEPWTDDEDETKQSFATS